MPPHPAPPNRRNCVFQKRAFYEHGFGSAGINKHVHTNTDSSLHTAYSAMIYNGAIHYIYIYNTYNTLYIYMLLFCELLSHLHVMVLDVQYNALPARVSFNVGYSIISEGVAQVQHSEGLGSPCSDPCVRVGSHKRGGGGVAPCFAAREGLGVSLVGGGKGIAKGPLPVSTLVAEATAAGGGNRTGRLPLEAGDPGCQVMETIQWGLVQLRLRAQVAQAIQLCRICPGT